MESSVAPWGEAHFQIPGKPDWSLLSDLHAALWFRFHPSLPAVSVKMCWNFPLEHSCGLLASRPRGDSVGWCRSAGLLVGRPSFCHPSYNTWRQQDCTMCPPFSPPLSTLVMGHGGGVSFLSYWLWTWPGDWLWPMEGGHDRMLVICWGSKGFRCPLPFCFCQQWEELALGGC